MEIWRQNDVMQEVTEDGFDVKRERKKQSFYPSIPKGPVSEVG